MHAVMVTVGLPDLQDSAGLGLGFRREALGFRVVKGGT